METRKEKKIYKERKINYLEAMWHKKRIYPNPKPQGYRSARGRIKLSHEMALSRSAIRREATVKLQ